MSDKEIYELNLKNAAHYGAQLQMNQFTEELAELIQAIAEENPAHIAEEIADVEIMVEQMEYLLPLGIKYIKAWAEQFRPSNDILSCIWYLAAPIKSINKLRRVNLVTAADPYISEEEFQIRRQTAENAVETSIGELICYLDWLAVIVSTLRKFGKSNPTRCSAPVTALRRRPPMVKPEPWENPMLDTMWSFMQMGGLKANYPALKEACMELRQMLMQKTAGQRKDRPKDLSWENLERVKVTIICESMALVLSGDYEKMEAQHDS